MPTAVCSTSGARRFRPSCSQSVAAALIAPRPVRCTLSLGGPTPVLSRRFPIQTGYDGYLGSNMYYIDEENGVGVYPGLTDIEADLDGRLAVMNRALEVSLDAPDLDESNSTLKIFLAPEFFFRGPMGAYSAEDPALLELGDKLRSMVADTRWRDWVFVFGSVIGATKIARPEKTNLTGGPSWDAYNFAIVQRGNSPERYTHFKRYISGIDFLTAVPDNPGAIVFVLCSTSALHTGISPALVFEFERRILNRNVLRTAGTPT
jgi:hypothetical protein